MNAVQWNGSYEGVMIESDTDPWLEVDGKRIDFRYAAIVPGTCEEGGHLIDGVLGMHDCGIERCDACDLFDGDLSAALAYAEHLNVGATVWYFPAEDDE